jgi:hypothetical protein
MRNVPNPQTRQYRPYRIPNPLVLVIVVRGTVKKVLRLFVNGIISKEQQIIARKKFNPEDVLGKPYARGLLLYGGGVTRGKISFAISEEEHLDGLKRLKSIKSIHS